MLKVMLFLRKKKWKLFLSSLTLFLSLLQTKEKGEIPFLFILKSSV